MLPLNTRDRPSRFPGLVRPQDPVTSFESARTTAPVAVPARRYTPGSAPAVTDRLHHGVAATASHTADHCGDAPSCTSRQSGAPRHGRRPRCRRASAATVGSRPSGTPFPRARYLRVLAVQTAALRGIGTRLFTSLPPLLQLFHGQPLAPAVLCQLGVVQGGTLQYRPERGLRGPPFMTGVGRSRCAEKTAVS